MADGFIFYRSFAEAFDDLDAETFKKIVQAVCRYALDGAEPDNLTVMEKMAFSLIRPQIDANNERRESGKKGGRPKKTSETSGFEDENHRFLENENSETSGFDISENEKPKEKVKEKVKDKVNVKENVEKEIIAPSPSSEPASDLEPIPLNDGTEWTPSISDAEEYHRLYPAVDLRQEFRNMRGWCTANPSRKKTPRGVKAFVNTWLSKEQNRGRKAPPPEPKRNTFTDMEEHDHDMAALERELILRSIKGA